MLGEQKGRNRARWERQPIAVKQAKPIGFLDVTRKLCIKSWSKSLRDKIMLVCWIYDDPIHHRGRVAKRLLPEATGAFVNDILEVNSRLWIQCIDFGVIQVFENPSPTIVLREEDDNGM